MSYYYECTTCGSRLDPGERCDCHKEEERTDKDDEPHGEKTRSDTFYGIGAKEEKDTAKAAIERRTR
ncbi:MAG: hypothetical protein EOM14_05115 [Clostridia bacterium]|nr:hypothetical protein [Clostridia bacterium]